MAYKYANAHDWLEERITGTSDLDYLRGIIRSLAGECYGDDLQDIFQSEMSGDGYFVDLDAEEEDEDDGGGMFILLEDEDDDFGPWEDDE